MRVLLLLRGSPGCGKSTWIEQNGLKPYALSADDLRLLYASPRMSVSGGEEITQQNDHIVWGTLFKILETRMQNGEFTVIDATNSKTSEMNRYKELCDSYKYRIYCVDFTSIPIDVVKQRNKMRLPVKQVPEDVIDKMYSRFETQKIPSGITVIQPDELDKIWMKLFDLSEYKKIHVVGDIHGCMTALNEYFDMCDGMKDDEFYIFTGDYIDRGIENAEVVKFLLSIYNKPNVLLLEGNHERWLWVWANSGVSQSREFEFVTKSQLDNADIDKKQVRQLYRRIGQCAYFKYGDNIYVVNHAGISTLPENLTLVATRQMTNGVGGYNEFEDVAASFLANTPDNVYQIHGHRNTKKLPVQVNERVFNLEGGVEFGGCLRCVQISNGNNHDIFEIKNNVFADKEINIDATDKKCGDGDVGKMIMDMRQNQYISEKRYGNISSFNFTKLAFYNKVWDEQTMKARGLYINIPKQKIVARAYDKFFNINERPETKLDMLQYKIEFPATAYVKENGFLGIVSYNEETDDLFITTKSSPDGDYAAWLADVVMSKISPDAREKMKQYSKENDVSFVFECVDMVNDPHIIEYDDSELYLLDIVRNTMEFSKYSFDDMCHIADDFGIKHKEKAYTLNNWQEFFDWYYMVVADGYKYNCKNIEGFVVEGSNGYMVKVKLAYYNFWKFMRSISHEAIRKGYIDRKRTSALTTPLANKYYAWVKTLHDVDDQENLPKDICSLRKMFYSTDEGKQFMCEE